MEDTDDGDGQDTRSAKSAPGHLQEYNQEQDGEKNGQNQHNET